jgi:uncharacterized membrane protein YphA (DoxX/SURF4 family)
LRIVAALLFIEHGLQKYIGFPSAGPPMSTMFWIQGAIEIVGGILLLVTRRDMLVTIVAAMLTALGTQTFFLFVGYAFGLDFGTNKMGVGGGVGMLAGFVLAAAGIIGLIGEAGYFRRQSAM